MALHLLIVLAVFKDTKHTSERLAKSIGCNPVMVRNMLGGLKAAGLVEVHRGTGGASLIADPKDVSVWDVYQAVDSATLDQLMGTHQNPEMRCPVGCKIHSILDKPYDMITQAVQKAMSAYTLQQMLDDYYEQENGTKA